MRNQMDSATYQRTLPDGTPMMDFEGKPIIGPKQLKTQLNLQKASSASSLEKMSDEERAAAIAALTKAREQDAAAAEKAAQRSANASQRAQQEGTGSATETGSRIPEGSGQSRSAYGANG